MGRRGLRPPAATEFPGTGLGAELDRVVAARAADDSMLRSSEACCPALCGFAACRRTRRPRCEDLRRDHRGPVPAVARLARLTVSVVPCIVAPRQLT